LSPALVRREGRSEFYQLVLSGKAGNDFGRRERKIFFKRQHASRAGIESHESNVEMEEGTFHGDILPDFGSPKSTFREREVGSNPTF
jgi:hypothetical protein